MVPGLNPVIELAKLPAPVPSVLLSLEVVGLTDVLQQTPLAVTEAPPSDVTFPPLEALVEFTEDIAVVVTVGALVAAVVCVVLSGNVIPSGDIFITPCSSASSSRVPSDAVCPVFGTGAVPLVAAVVCVVLSGNVTPSGDTSISAFDWIVTMKNDSIAAIIIILFFIGETPE